VSALSGTKRQIEQLLKIDGRGLMCLTQSQFFVYSRKFLINFRVTKTSTMAYKDQRVNHGQIIKTLFSYKNNSGICR